MHTRNQTLGWSIVSRHHSPLYQSWPLMHPLLFRALTLQHLPHCQPPLLYWMITLTLTLPFNRVVLLPIPLELHLKIPAWAQNLQHLQRLFGLTVTPQGIFVLTVRSTNVLTVANVPPVTPNIIALETTVLFAAASATHPADATS